MGRPKLKNAKRDRTGKARGEPDHIIKAVAWDYRAKNGTPASQVDDPMSGYTLGKLRLRWQSKGDQDPSSISPEQFDAGDAFGKLIRRHAAVLGYEIDRVKSPGFEMVSYGVPCGQEADADYVQRVREQFKDAYKALVDEGTRVATMTYDICLDRVAASALTVDDIGILRIGLNALCHLTKGRKSLIGEMR